MSFAQAVDRLFAHPTLVDPAAVDAEVLRVITVRQDSTPFELVVARQRAANEVVEGRRAREVGLETAVGGV